MLVPGAQSVLSKPSCMSRGSSLRQIPLANYLIVGGAGFIGVNAAEHYAEAGHNLSMVRA
jgi:NADPH-dependent 2,4-dienoyl-CoA reductase/sulfur reductase-like enzyme